jgi:hypothetical protein
MQAKDREHRMGSLRRTVRIICPSQGLAQAPRSNWKDCYSPIPDGWSAIRKRFTLTCSRLFVEVATSTGWAIPVNLTSTRPCSDSQTLADLNEAAAAADACACG